MAQASAPAVVASTATVAVASAARVATVVVPQAAARAQQAVVVEATVSGKRPRSWALSDSLRSSNLLENDPALQSRMASLLKEVRAAECLRAHARAVRMKQWVPEPSSLMTLL